MVNYSVTDWVSSRNNLSVVLAEMETYLETIDNSKTIRAIGVIPLNNNMAQGYIIHDA